MSPFSVLPGLRLLLNNTSRSGRANRRPRPRSGIADSTKAASHTQSSPPLRADIPAAPSLPCLMVDGFQIRHPLHTQPCVGARGRRLYQDAVSCDQLAAADPRLPALDPYLAPDACSCRQGYSSSVSVESGPLVRSQTGRRFAAFGTPVPRREPSGGDINSKLRCCPPGGQQPDE